MSQSIFILLSVLCILLMLSLVVIVYSNRRFRKKMKHQVAFKKRIFKNKKEEVEKERKRSDELMRNILPSAVAEQLNNYGKSAPRSHDMVTVLFTDFKGFTGIAERMTPKNLVTELDQCFRKFDEIISRHRIEKIKTIGDSYMCAGGIPADNLTNAVDMVCAALEIQEYMQWMADEKIKKGEDPWQLRIGIHTGPVVAGIVGSTKFSYDIWGDAVNIASRMESSGEAGRINISGATYEKVKEYFDCSFRGKVQAKNKGEIEMYFVDSIKSELSVNGLGKKPSDEFYARLKQSPYSEMNYKKLGQYVVKYLSEQLPEELHYHSIHHTLGVCSAAERIGKAEGIGEEDLCLLKTAALLHDAGYTRRYDDNEPIGALIAREILPLFGYNNSQIDQVAQLILSTQIPQKPVSLLEKILCDADLDYLGKKDFDETAETLKQELLHYGKLNEQDWNMIQVRFLEKHQYFTDTCRKLREEKKQEHLARLKQQLQLAGQ